MVLKSITKISLSLLFIVTVLTSCEDLYIVNCDECDTVEPTTCRLYVDLGAYQFTNPEYDVTIYRGKVEDGIVIHNRKTFASFDQIVSLNSEYTVTATVVVNGKEYTAVDSTIPGVDVITDVCEEVCYWIVNNNIDLVIKYY